MSKEYDEYLREHISNVNQAMLWLADNLTPNHIVRDIDISLALDRVAAHDESKYKREEYEAYDGYFYGGNRSYDVVTAFDYAWLIHQRRNPHHWQYWVLIQDDQAGLKPLIMPNSYILEMIADWWSFSWKSGNLEEIFDWYEKHKNGMLLHDRTRKIVEKILDEMHLKIIEQNWEALEHSDIEDKKYGVPEEKKFPMPDADHVRSAIRFFNYVDPKYEKELAKAILKRMDEYGLTFDDFTVGDENRFKNYIPKEDLEHSGVKGMHWGERNGPPYPLDSKNIAEQIFKEAQKKSEKIGKDISDAAEKSGGKLHGLENNLKTVESIERKLNKKISENDISLTEAANEIKDSLRYTLIASDDIFVNAYNEFKNDLLSKGYEETDCKNYFDLFNQGKVKHKAVQSNFSDSDGYEFEVQFQTPASQDAKDKKLPLYNERRSSGISEERKQELEKQMEDLALKVPDPSGIETIESHGYLKHSEEENDGDQGENS